MLDWHEQVPIGGSIELPPDARALDGLGRNHSTKSALADLIDNSIDASASRITIRFIKKGGALRSLCVADDGCGMTAQQIDRAMTVGGRRSYSESDLGHFGIGLKGASFSQAAELTVISCSEAAPAIGRKWDIGALTDSYSCDIVDSHFAEAELRKDWGLGPARTATLVRWDGVHTFPATTDQDRIDEYLSQTISTLCIHLGMVFHRILKRFKVEINIDVMDADSNVVAPPVPVLCLDPFAYSRSGDPHYPTVLEASDGTNTLAMTCHIWPGRSAMPEYRLSDGGPMAHQGRAPRLAPGRGFARHLRRAIEDEVPLLTSEEPLHIRWKRLHEDDFFEVDHPAKTLWLNAEYRNIINGERPGTLNDAPLVKALLFLLVEDVFNGEYLGARDRDNIDLWTEVLTAAVKAERR